MQPKITPRDSEGFGRTQRMAWSLRSASQPTLGPTDVPCAGTTPVATGRGSSYARTLQETLDCKAGSARVTRAPCALSFRRIGLRGGCGREAWGDRHGRYGVGP